MVVPKASANVLVSYFLTLLCSMALWAGEKDGDTGVFEAPADLGACQVGYGSTGQVRLSWSNPERYEMIVVSIDGLEVPAYIDGAFGTAEVDATTGGHTFEVVGCVGEFSSLPAMVDLEVLLETPMADPVSDLECEYFPEGGGSLRITWFTSDANDSWVVGEVRLGGRLGNVEFPPEGNEVVVSLHGVRPEEVEVAFKNAMNYFSEPSTVPCPQLTPAFLRGECDGNGRICISDAVYLTNHLFLGGRRWFCDDACDANDDGQVDLADGLWILNYLFRGGKTPMEPFTDGCGVDPTEDVLGGLCESPACF